MEEKRVYICSLGTAPFQQFECKIQHFQLKHFIIFNTTSDTAGTVADRQEALAWIDTTKALVFTAAIANLYGEDNTGGKDEDVDTEEEKEKEKGRPLRTSTKTKEINQAPACIASTKTDPKTVLSRSELAVPYIGSRLLVARLARKKSQYLADIQSSLDSIAKGDTYEVCLTTGVHIDVIETPPIPLLYSELYFIMMILY